MSRSSFALFVALLIHALLFLLFWLLGVLTPEIKKEQKENKIKISLKEMPQKFKEAGEAKKPTQKPMDIAPPMPKGSQLKEIVKYNQKKIQEEPKSNTLPINNKPEPKEKKVEDKKIEPLPPEEPYIPLEKPKEEKKTSNDPFSWMKEDKSSQEPKQESKKSLGGSNVANSDIRELYGDEFGKLTPGQQQYLLDNQEIMRRITQEVLNRVAQVNLKRDMNINSTNIIEFYLHPNGDMSDFKFLKKSGHYILDDTTKETIEYAYSRYPRPKEKILIRYNVFYNLARY